MKIGDLVSKDSTLFNSDKIGNFLLLSCLSFVIIGIIGESKWRSIIKEKTLYEPQPLTRTPHMSIAGNLVDLFGATSKMVYKEIQYHKQTSLTAKAKILGRYPESGKDFIL